jgi:hypothetical protein
LSHDAVSTDPDHAAVVSVGDHDLTVRQWVRIVRGVEEACASARNARPAEEMDTPMRFYVDRDDRVRFLFIRHNRAAAARDKTIVVEIEVHASPEVLSCRKAPEDFARGIHEQDAVVSAIRDQESARERPDGFAFRRDPNGMSRTSRVVLVIREHVRVGPGCADDSHRDEGGDARERDAAPMSPAALERATASRGGA